MISDELLGKLFEFCIFVVKIYVKQWITCKSAIQAPANDLQFLQYLRAYRQQNEVIASAAMEVFLRHLWYLSEQCAGFAFFDERISDEKKIEMVASLDREPNVGNQFRNRTIGPDDDIDIASLVSKETMRFFEILSDNRPLTFLETHPSQWKQDNMFNTLYQIVKDITITNEPAERMIALISEFNDAITTSEEQKQYLLQNVEFSRKAMPDIKKKTIVEALKKA